MADADAPISMRERQKAQTRGLILDGMVAAIAAGDWSQATHEALARRAGVSRQTVYRHFPDQQNLMSAVWSERLNPLFLGEPRLTEAELVENLPHTYAKFEDQADLIGVVQSTPQGRALRMSAKDRRAAMFREATAAATQGLSEREATMATAAIQLLHGGQAWIEMRQQWGLSSQEAAKACAWAIRTLLADLHARKGLALGEKA
jgi:AcrR family transcriptional regulator